MALDTTIGGASSDSYGTLAEYEAYVVSRIDAGFNGHGHDSTHEMHLRRAAQYLDSTNSFIGMQQYQTQSLAWPRLTNDLVNGWPVNPDTVPDAIKHAQFELAYAFEADGATPETSVTTGGVVRQRSKAGPVETETEYAYGRSVARYVMAENLLRPYVGGVSSGQVRLHRG